MRKNISYLAIIPLLLITSSCSCLRWNGEQPQGLISPEKADTLEMNYIKNQYRFINNSVANDSIIYGEETIFERGPNSNPFRIGKKKSQEFLNPIFWQTQNDYNPKLSKEVLEKIDSIYKIEGKISAKNFKILLKMIQEQPIDYKDTREAWFSFNEIVGYLTMAQKHADSMGYKNLGIRIYLGSYIKDGKPKTTVFLVATYRNPNNATIHNTLLARSNSTLTIDPDDPELQIDMEGAGYLNMGSSRRRPPE